MHTLVCLLLGAAMGFLSGLIGVGDDVIAVPGMIFLLGTGVRDAMGTSLAAIALIAIVGSWKQYQQQHVDLGAAAGLAAGGVVFAWLGAWCNHRTDPAVLQRVFAAFILIVGAKMFVDSFRAPRAGDGAGTGGQRTQQSG